MQTINEETLILFYYGELDDAEAEALRARLAADPALAEAFARLTAELDGLPEPAAPARDANYGRRVWARVDAAIEAEERSRAIGWREWLLPKFPAAMKLAGAAFVLAAVGVVAFQLGRQAPTEPSVTIVESVPAGTAGDQRARLLEASLVTHLDSADRLLTEIANNQSAEIDIEAEKDWAKTLLVANRLYRFAAEQAGQHRIAQLLADMEPVLIELANGAGQLTPDEYRVLRQSISDRDLLFKVRTTNNALKPQNVQL